MNRTPETGAGGAVRVMREAQGLSLRELAEMAGTSHSYLSQVERGDAVASKRVMQALLSALAANLRGAA